MGAGRTEIMRAIYGIDKLDEGELISGTKKSQSGILGTQLKTRSDS